MSYHGLEIDMLTLGDSKSNVVGPGYDIYTT